MISYGHQSIDKKDIEAVVKVLKSDWLTQGPKVFEFEKALADYCGVRYAVAVCNGTAALHLAYLAAGLKPDDEVITSPNTFMATTNMLLTLGAKPVFCDIRSDTYNINEEKIKKLITKRTKAIVPVHFAGQPCEMDKISKIAQKHKLIVIEDACHALGAKFKNKKIGSGRYSDMTVFSFHPVKSITTGEGGAVLTNNKKYYEKLIAFRSHGIHKDKSGKNIMTALGYNYRLTDIQAVLGLSQLKKIDCFINKRRRIVKWYEQELKQNKNFILPVELENSYSSWHLYVIKLKNYARRDQLMEFMKNKKIGVNYHYPAVYSQPYYRGHGYKNIHLLNTDIYSNSCVTLPLHTLLTNREIKYVSNQLNEFFR